MKKLLIVGMAASFCLMATAAEKHWLGTTSASASADANWSPEGAPTAADDVILDASSNNNPMTWDLDNGVASWSQSSYTGTVTFQTGVGMTGVTCHGVDTGVMAGEKGLPISGNLSLLSGTWTHTEQPAFGSERKKTENYKQGYGVYRIVVSVGGTCQIGADAKIDVNGKGFAGNSGPGYANSCASHGGFGAYNYNVTTAQGAIYGSLWQPISSGSGRSTRGGGAVKLTVAGALTLNGTITSIGPRTGYYPGAGGSIWVTAASLAGSGSLSADGGAGTTTVGCGGGGRVAVYLTGTDSDFSAFTGTMTALNANEYGSCGTVYRETKADEGAGELILESGLTIDSPAPKFYGDLACGTLLKPTYAGEETHAFRKITLGKWTRLYVTDGQTLTIGKDGVVGHSASKSSLQLYGTSLNLPADFHHQSFCLANYRGNSTINIGTTTDSTYTLQSGGSMSFNAPVELMGSLVVSGSVTHAGNAAAPAYTNRLDLTVTGDMTIASGGQVDVTMVGYPAESGPGGSSSNDYGGTYGGIVPDSGKNVYGSILHPTDLGSSGVKGGAAGAVKLTVAGTLTVENGGWIRAYGNNNGGGSNASGGSIWLTVGQIQVFGSGRIDAKGGSYGGTTAHAAAGGSGGRIAVRQTVGNKTYDQFPGVFYYEGGSSTGGTSSGAGTLYWEKASDGLDAGTVYSCNWLPPDGMPADELEKATIQVGAKATQNLLADLRVGDYKLPSGATLMLNGHTLKVLAPKSSYKKSVLGTVDVTQGGTLDWKKRGMIIIVH